jgi:hypothetical protein
MTTAPEPSAAGEQEQQPQQEEQQEEQQPVAEKDDWDKEFDRILEARSPQEEAATEAAPDPGKVAPEPEAGKPAAEDQESAARELTDDDLLEQVPEAQRVALGTRLKAAKEAAEKAIADAQRAEHQFKSAQGRIAALERKAPAGDEPAGAKDRKPDGAQEAARWKKFAEDYPDIAEAMENRFKEFAATVAVPPEFLEFVAQQRETAEMQQKISEVSSAHEDFVQIVRRPEFGSWVEKQSPKVQALVNSRDPEDVILGMTLYKAANPQVTSPPKKDAAAGAASAAETAEAAALRAKRAAQRGATEAPSVQRTIPQPLDADDEDAMFAFYAKKADARNSARR